MPDTFALCASLVRPAASGDMKALQGYLDAATARLDALATGQGLEQGQRGRRRPPGVETSPDGTIRLDRKPIGTIQTAVPGGYEIRVNGFSVLRLSCQFTALDLAARMARRHP